ncbi:hypothetical protein BaRGS_00004321 [Batillaria attramentaria]|uniref:Uncharacterized protein n=1 Tax=Batillaria attramentaria TaxID=370345 RepID=A0ABD0LXU1_9CAEN
MRRLSKHSSLLVCKLIKKISPRTKRCIGAGVNAREKKDRVVSIFSKHFRHADSVERGLEGSFTYCVSGVRPVGGPSSIQDFGVTQVTETKRIQKENVGTRSLRMARFSGLETFENIAPIP